MVICKPFTGPYLGYGDAIYEQTSNVLFSHKTESVQQNAALLITAAIKASYPNVINCIQNWGLSISSKEDGYGGCI